MVTGTPKTPIFTWILLQVEFLEIRSIDFESAGQIFLLGGSQQLIWPIDPHNVCGPTSYGLNMSV